jgi:hypothetical protein
MSETILNTIAAACTLVAAIAGLLLVVQNSVETDARRRLRRQRLAAKRKQEVH